MGLPNLYKKMGDRWINLNPTQTIIEPFLLIPII
jgi:hypothetical protein